MTDFQNTAAKHLESAKGHYKNGNFGAAINDLNRTLELDPSCEEAQVLLLMLQEILDFRYTDVYNP